jgi:hypothetical protein
LPAVRLRRQARVLPERRGEILAGAETHVKRDFGDRPGRFAQQGFGAINPHQGEVVAGRDADLALELRLEVRE